MQPSPYVAYKVLDFPDHATIILRNTNNPEFNDHKIYSVPVTFQLDQYIRTAVSLPFTFSASLSLSFFLSLSLSLFTCLSTSLTPPFLPPPPPLCRSSVCLCLSFLYLFLPLSICLSVYLYLSLSLSLSLSLFLFLYPFWEASSYDPKIPDEVQLVHCVLKKKFRCIFLFS